MEIDQILNIRKGLPVERQNHEILLKQFIVGQLGRIHSASLIFDDGKIFMIGIEPETKENAWQPFTELKPEGLRALKLLIRDEFLAIDEEQWGGVESHNLLIWETGTGKNRKRVVLPSGSYDSLPPVFKKIDDLINRFMYRIFEKPVNQH